MCCTSMTLPMKYKHVLSSNLKLNLYMNYVSYIIYSRLCYMQKIYVDKYVCKVCVCVINLNFNMHVYMSMKIIGNYMMSCQRIRHICRRLPGLIAVFMCDIAYFIFYTREYIPWVGFEPMFMVLHDRCTDLTSLTHLLTKHECLL